MKMVRGVENMLHLDALVTQDLKDIGIKVPKLKKDSDEVQHQVTSPGVFGKYLGQLPSCDYEGCGPVPKFLIDIVNLIEKDISLEGIFRKSGSVSRLKDLRAKVDAGEDISDACALDLCSLFKQFFRDLQEPLLTTRLQESFLSCYDLAPVQRTAAVMLLCHLLPDHHLATLRFVTSFLHQVAAHSDVNKMDAANISVCLAPNIFHERSGKILSVADGEAAKSAVAAPTSIVELLIEHSDEIGVIDVDLNQRLVLMATCFSDSVIDDSELEATENREKKRSGSFQGLISNLSNSFIKWRNRDKLNSSAVQSSALVTCSTDICDDASYVSLTPVVIRKRKAEDDPLPFSTGKKLAILRSMPQNAVLGSTPYMASNRKGKVADDLGSSTTVMPPVTPCCKKLDSNKLGDDLSDVASLKYRPPGSTQNKIRRGNSIDSSPVNSPQLSKNKVRKSFEGLIRRLSGGKDTQSREKIDLLMHKCSGNKESQHLPQRSPSAPSIGPLHDSNACLFAGCQSLHSSFSCQPDETENANWLDNSKRSVGRQRSLSVDGTTAANTSLRRGRPNTVRAGLPSPLNRRPSEVDCDPCVTLPVLESVQSTASLIDTSPIVSDTSRFPQLEDKDLNDCEVAQQISERSFVVEDDTLDQAFIGSVLDADTVMLTDGVDLDVSETFPEATRSVDCRDSENSDRFIGGHDKQNSGFDQRRTRDRMERFVSLVNRSGCQGVQMSVNSACSVAKTVPKIKPSLMSDTINKRLFVKTSSPHVPRMAAVQFSSPVCVRRNIELKEPDDSRDPK